MAASEEQIQRFMMAQERAKKLIQMDVNGGLQKYATKAKEMAATSLNENIEPQYQQMSQTPTSIPQNYSTSLNKTASKLPKEILESFKNKPIDTAPLGYGVNSSILDEVNYRTQGKLYKKEPQLTEQQTQQTQSTPYTVDYSMIKMIVEECMKKYVGSLKKTILNESKTTNNDELQAMKIGEKFSFITKNGDLYEAQLKFIKNINNKKKEV